MISTDKNNQTEIYSQTERIIFTLITLGCICLTLLNLSLHTSLACVPTYWACNFLNNLTVSLVAVSIVSLGSYITVRRFELVKAAIHEGDLIAKFRDASLLAQEIPQAGIIALHEELPEGKVHQCIADAKEEVKVLQSFLWHPGDAIKYVEIAKSHTRVRIILLAPESFAAKQRSLDLDLNENYARSQIEAFIHLLNMALENTPVDYLEVRYSECLPTMHITMADNIAFVGFYPRKMRAGQSPHLEIELQRSGTPTKVGAMVENHWNGIWDAAKKTPGIRLKAPEQQEDQHKLLSG